jgi:hypothetical protein
MPPSISNSYPKPHSGWQNGRQRWEALIMAAESRGPLMHAGVGMLRALNRNVVREFNPERKESIGVVGS